MSSPRHNNPNSFGGRAHRTTPRDGATATVTPPLHRKGGSERQVDLKSGEWEDGRDDPLDDDLMNQSAESTTQETGVLNKPEPATINLLDIAKQAKEQKGDKGYERISGPRVYVLEDEVGGPAPREEDWEDVGAEEKEPIKSYSSVVRDT